MSFSITELDNTVRAFYEGKGDVVCVLLYIFIFYLLRPFCFKFWSYLQIYIDRYNGQLPQKR